MGRLLGLPCFQEDWFIDQLQVQGTRYFGNSLKSRYEKTKPEGQVVLRPATQITAALAGSTGVVPLQGFLKTGTAHKEPQSLAYFVITDTFLSQFSANIEASHVTVCKDTLEP